MRVHINYHKGELHAREQQERKRSYLVRIERWRKNRTLPRRRRTWGKLPCRYRRSRSQQPLPRHSLVNGIEIGSRDNVQCAMRYAVWFLKRRRGARLNRYQRS